MNRMRAVFGGIQTNTDFTQRDLGLDFRVVSDNNRQLTRLEEGLPDINLSGYIGFGSGGPVLSTKQVWEWSDNVSVATGRHNLKLGGLFRLNSVDLFGGNIPRGYLNFTNHGL